MTEPVPPVFNIEGDLVALGPARRDLIPVYLRWVNDVGTTRTLAIQPRPLTLEQEIAWYDSTATDESRHFFTIYERATGRPIGNCELAAIDVLNRRGEVGIMIGESQMRGRGYGTEAMRLLLDFAFTALGLHSVMLSVYAYNPAAYRSYQKAGFRELGRRREAHWYNGRFWDEIFMDILASEFESPVLARVLTPDENRS